MTAVGALERDPPQETAGSPATPGQRAARVLRDAAATFVTACGGLLLVSALFAGSPWMWLLWIAVGAAAGGIAARGRLVWAAWLGVLAFFPAAPWFGVATDQGPFWLLGVLVGAGEVGIGFALGLTWSRRQAPWRTVHAGWRGLPATRRRLVTVAAAVALLGSAAYTVGIGIVGSSEMLNGDHGPADCRTPAQYGWAYEAINYDLADDLRLTATNPDMRHCAGQGATAGDEVVSRDGVHVAGFYIPAASGVGPTAPTVIVVPGWKANKSSMLKYAALFHATFNVVAIDLRNNGRASPAATTTGLHEQLDLEAMVDWLARTKHPRWIGVVGNSLGGATALAAAVHDPRIAALVLDSMHAQAVVTGGRILETRGHPSLPGSWAIFAVMSLRVGADVTQVDPVRTITQLGHRPVLLIHGTADRIDRPSESVERNFHAALEAGVPVELEYCVGADHSEAIDRCAADWSRWAVSFFTAASTAAAA